MAAAIIKSRVAILELIEEASPKKLDDDEIKKLVLDTIQNDLVENGKVFRCGSGRTGDTIVNEIGQVLMVEVLTISKIKLFKVYYIEGNGK